MNGNEINKDHVIKIKNWFLDYVGTFNCNDNQCRSATLLKKKHSFRVCKEILSIGRALHLKDSQLYIAEIMAILHDIGRFTQYGQYGTFIDDVSVDHADVGVTIINSNKILDNVDPHLKDLILKAIFNHNRRTLPHEEISDRLFFSKLLRDADKLDIWRLFVENQLEKKNGAGYGLSVRLPDSPDINESVYSDLLHKRIVNSENVYSLNDLKLLRLGWIYDINFIPTFKLIKKRDYINRIQSTLPRSNVKVKKVCSDAQAYLDGIINGSDLTSSELSN